MLKYSFLAAVFCGSLIGCVTAHAVPAMSMDAQSDALASNAPVDEVEPAAAAADVTHGISTLHGPHTGDEVDSGEEASHVPMRPEGATATRAPTAVHAMMGADAASPPPAPKHHSTVRWQSLLPGVMK